MADDDNERGQGPSADASPDVSGATVAEPSASPDGAPPAPPAPPDGALPASRAVAAGADSSGVWGFFTRAWGEADPRSLGLFRILLGALLVFDVARRLPYYEAHYTDAGWLSSHFALYRPMSSHLFSVYHAFGTPTEVGVLLGFHLLVNVLLLVGWRTKLMHVLAAVLITSLNSRNIMMENGGYVVTNLLTVWSLFLPLGRRFSIDALRSGWRTPDHRTAEALTAGVRTPRDAVPVHSLAVLAILLQWSVIYYFNTVHKFGPSWKDGTALHYFLQQDRIVTPLGAMLRDQMPLGAIKALTWGTLAVEGSIPVLLLLPVFRGLLRKLAWLAVIGLHLAIGVMASLGPFAWVMMVPFAALLTAKDWQWLAERLRRRRQPRVIRFDPADGFSVDVCHFVERLDALGLVRFEALDAERGEETLSVTDAEGATVWRGSAALARLADALPLPKLALTWVRLPGIRGFVDGRLARVAKERARVTRALGCGGPRVGAEATPLGPTDAQRVVSRLRQILSEACVAALLVAAGSQVLMENHAVPERIKVKTRPEWMTAVVVYPRLFQGWSMFAPDPPKEDGKVVVDGLTEDGRAFDPLTGKEPSFDVQPPRGYEMDALWQAFHTRIHEGRFYVYHNGFRDYLQNVHRLTGREQDRLVAADVWYVHEVIPPPGQPHPPSQRRKLFSWGSRPSAQGERPRPPTALTPRLPALPTPMPSGERPVLPTGPTFVPPAPMVPAPPPEP